MFSYGTHPRGKTEAFFIEINTFIFTGRRYRRWQFSVLKRPVIMALILGTKPKYVLADEPTSALDEANRDLLLELLRKYQKTAAILFISHDTEAMKALCPITHVMERGKIIETQATEQLFIHPQQPWTKRFAEAAYHREEVNWKWTALN